MTIVSFCLSSTPLAARKSSQAGSSPAAFSFHPPSASFSLLFSFTASLVLVNSCSVVSYILSHTSNYLVITWAAIVENPTRPLQPTWISCMGPVLSLVARAEQCFALLPNLHHFIHHIFSVSANLFVFMYSVMVSLSYAVLMTTIQSF